MQTAVSTHKKSIHRKFSCLSFCQSPPSGLATCYRCVTQTKIFCQRLSCWQDELRVESSGKKKTKHISICAACVHLHLQRHLDEHQQLLDADPDPLPFELLRDASPLFIREAPQKLRKKTKSREGFSALPSKRVRGINLFAAYCTQRFEVSRLCVCVFKNVCSWERLQGNA